jgi:hypothetical protein
MRLFVKAIAIAGCVTAASAAQAGPISYDEAISGDIVATIANIPVFELGVGDNVIAGSQSFAGNSFDFDIFSFAVPQDSVLRFVTVEFDAFSFTGPLAAFGPNYDVVRGLFAGSGQFIDTSQTATSKFTDVLTSVGPQNLFTRLPIGSGTYDWIDGLGRAGEQGIDFATTSAMWNYRLTFGVESTAVPEPGSLALMSLGLVALFLGRHRKSRRASVSGELKAA